MLHSITPLVYVFRCFVIMQQYVHETVFYYYQGDDERNTVGSSLITSASATATASSSNAWSSSTYSSGSYWGGYFGKSDTGK